MKMETRSPPIHLHVEEDVPVHVHMKRSHKKNKEKGTDDISGSSKYRSHADGHTRSRSLSERLPWVPAPALTTKPWSPRKGTLLDKELDLLRSEMPAKQKELDTDDELWANAKSRAYEKKLGGLMTEVGNLQTEVDLQKTLRESDRKDRALDESMRAIESQEVELQQTQKELHEKERENRRLRDVVSTLKDPSITSAHHGSGVERDRLLRKLVEAELDGQAAAEQALLLRDVALSLLRSGGGTRSGRGGSSTVTVSRWNAEAVRPLEQHRDLLVQKLCDFDETNRKLRELLRQRHGDEAELVRLEEQRGLLVEKLTLADEENERLRVKLKESERRVSSLNDDLERQEHISRSATAELQQTSMRSRVEVEAKDAELSQLVERVVRAEQEVASARDETSRIRQLLGTAEEKYRHDKDALKRASKVSKQRATSSEEKSKQLSFRLEDVTMALSDAQKSCDALQSRVDCLMAEKTGISAENVAVKSRLTELEAHVSRLIENHKEKQDTMASDLRLKNNDISSLKAENDRLRMNVATLESRLDAAEAQCRSVRADLRQADSASDDLKQQLSRARSASDEASSRLHEAELAIERLRSEGQLEMSKVRQRMESRLAELEPLPELLRASETRLSVAAERLSNFEKQNRDTMALLAELTAKAEQQSAELSSWKERYMTLDTSTQGRLGQLQSKLGEAEARNAELLMAAARRDEALTHTNLKLERSTQDCGSLARQLEQLRADWRKSQDEAAERAASKERALHDRAKDAEERLCSSSTELARLRRDKEEADRKLNARIFDLKERLEQSHSTNKSMQNYVQFLKSSYASVFGDASALAAPAAAAGSSAALRGPPRAPRY